MNVKMQPQSVGLCGSCDSANVTEFSNSDVIIRCDMHRMRIKQPVVRCSVYSEKSGTSLDSMYTLAWVVRTDKSGIAIGFKPPGLDRD